MIAVMLFNDSFQLLRLYNVGMIRVCENAVTAHFKVGLLSQQSFEETE
jgi:hypothetical protein